MASLTKKDHDLRQQIMVTAMGNHRFHYTAGGNKNQTEDEMEVTSAWVNPEGEIIFYVTEELALAVKELLAVMVTDWDVRIPEERRHIKAITDSIEKIDKAVEESKAKLNAEADKNGNVMEGA